MVAGASELALLLTFLSSLVRCVQDHLNPMFFSMETVMNLTRWPGFVPQSVHYVRLQSWTNEWIGLCLLEEIFRIWHYFFVLLHKGDYITIPEAGVCDRWECDLHALFNTIRQKRMCLKQHLLIFWLLGWQQNKLFTQHWISNIWLFSS